MSIDSAVLVVGFQRPKEIRLILSQASKAGIKSIYLSVDAPRVTSHDSLMRSTEIRELAEEFRSKFNNFSVRFLPVNVGCSANLLSACDWAFANENRLIILEDDCIPNDDFFDYVEYAFKKLSEDPEVLLICGTQFHASETDESFIIKSRYSLTWGWATTKSNWAKIRHAFSREPVALGANLLTTNYEEIYWNEGARRAISGYVDVWDTALVDYLHLHQSYAYLPSQNLVRNVGNDSVATHTGSDQNWVNTDTGLFNLKPDAKIKTGEENDLWLKVYFFKIRPRHLISTRITRLRDAVKKPPYAPLKKRWDEASKY